MPELIDNLDISGYRGLSGLRVEGLGKVNLITGKNNSGKSTVLECIRLLATGGSLQTFKEIVDYREEGGLIAEGERFSGASTHSPLSTLFNGCPDIHEPDSFFSISAQGSLPSSLSSLSAKIGWFVRKVDAQRQLYSYEPVASDLFEDVGESFPALDLTIAGRKRVVPFERFARAEWRVHQLERNSVSLPCVYLDPFSSRSTSQMGALWDAIALTDAEQEVVRALRVVSADIEAVSMIGERGRKGRTAIAKSKRFNSPVSLRTFGDGVNRLFGIVLSLCNARNGILLVDEIENGLHYTVQAEVWRTIFRLAKELNVQVFATSHSWDCIEGFQAAAIESPQDGVLVRITKRENAVIPTIFSEDELAIVARDKIEVR